MMKKICWLIGIPVFLLTIGCAKQPRVLATTTRGTDRAPIAGQTNNLIHYGGGDGLSMKTAIVIENAKGEDDGVRAEYHWISIHYPEWKTRGQALLQGKSGFFDKIICVKPDGKTVDLYFDISGFFGKW